jgi:hemerythrin superfamily protein
MQIKTGQPTFKDAIELLINDHKEVKKDFKKFEEFGDRAYVSKKKLAEKICLALKVHTLIEEEIFYPAVKKSAAQGEELINEAVVEHASAKELIAQIESMSAESELFDAKIKVLSEQIDHHVEEEEGQMFPQAKKADIDLAALGEKMAARKAQLMEAGI